MTKVRTIGAGAVLLAALLAGCAAEEEPAAAEPVDAAADQEPDDSGSMTLSEAFCDDLVNDGLTIMNLYGGVRDQFTPEEFADYAYGAAAISCPDALKDNEGLRTFLEAWDIDPDA